MCPEGINENERVIAEMESVLGDLWAVLRDEGPGEGLQGWWEAKAERRT